MILYLDTEFSDFINTELLSIALVSQDNKQFYAELPYNLKQCSDFVKEAVIPLLGIDLSAKLTQEAIKPRLLQWLEQFKNDEIVIVAFDYSGDWSLFCDAIDNEVPNWIQGVNVNNYVNELREEIFWRDNPELKRHHALNDAMALRASFVIQRAESKNWLDE